MGRASKVVSGPARGTLVLIIFFTLVAGAVLLASGNLSGDPGLGWHLKTGEHILSSYSVPRADLFLAPSPETPWIANQWLSDVLFWSALQGGGWKLLFLVTIALGFSAHALVPVIMLRRVGFHAGVIVLTVTFTLLTGSMQWITRPVVFSFLGTAITYAWALRVVTTGRPPPWFGTLLLFAVWANLHPAFPFGLAVIAAASAALLLLRDIAGAGKSFAWFLLAASGTLLNPWGVELHRSIFALVGDDYFMTLNVEWLPPVLGDPFFIAFFATLGLGAGGLFFVRGRELFVFSAINFLLFGIYSLLHRRGIPFFAIAAAVPVAFALQRGLRVMLERLRLQESGNLRFPFTAAGCAALLFLVLPFPGENWRIDAWYPQRLIDRIAESKEGGTIFTHPNWGGYLTYRLWPLARPFIDDRNELNGAERYRQYFAIVEAQEGWEETLRAISPSWALIPDEKPLTERLRNSSEWVEVGREDDFILADRTHGAVLFRRAMPWD